ncbi:hypothetical protein [Mycoplasma capricolum]|uniref:hypothetical protein n=1 Tax=Mycoplasma capricolum TaxID=2095 RepID=UPI003DA6A05E
MIRKSKLFVLTSICIVIFIWFYLNIDDIVLYSISGKKDGIFFKITMGSYRWLEEWNRLLEVHFYSNTSIKVWKEHIEHKGFQLQGFVEYNSLIYYLINLTKIGFGSLCFTLFITLCKKTIFNPFRDIWKYQKNRDVFVSSKMNETLIFLDKMLTRIQDHNVKKVFYSINSFPKLTYKPVFLIRLINDIKNSLLTESLKNELSYYENLITLVINFIGEIKKKEIHSLEYKIPHELFPLIKRTIEYYSKNSSYYLTYCINANQNSGIAKILTIWLTYLSWSSIFLLNLIIGTVFVFILNTIIYLVVYDKSNNLWFINSSIWLTFIILTISSSIIYLFISKNNNIISSSDNCKDKIKNLKNILENVKRITVKIMFFVVLTFIPIALYLKLDLFSSLIMKQTNPLFSKELDFILYHILYVNLLLYWLLSLIEIVRKEKKITVIIVFNKVFIPIFVLSFFIGISFWIKSYYRFESIDYKVKIIITILITIWIFIIIYEAAIYNPIAFIIYLLSFLVKLVFNWLFEIIENFFITINSNNKNTESVIITYLIKENPKNIHQIVEQFNIEEKEVNLIILKYLYKKIDCKKETKINILKYLCWQYQYTEKKLAEMFNVEKKKIETLIRKNNSKKERINICNKFTKQKNLKVLNLNIFWLIKVYILFMFVNLLLVGAFLFFFLHIARDPKILLILILWSIFNINLIIILRGVVLYKKNFVLLIILNLVALNISNIIILVLIYKANNSLHLIQEYNKTLTKL